MYLGNAKYNAGFESLSSGVQNMASELAAQNIKLGNFQIENPVNDIANNDNNVVLPNQEQIKTEAIKNTTSIDIETL